MKLATLRDGGLDGRLVVVSRDVTRCSDARHVAPTLQAALDDWERVAPQLELVARGVETGGQPVERFHERDAMAPLPRARGFATAWDGAASLRREASEGFLGAREAVRVGGAGVEVRAGVAVVADDGTAVRLVMLALSVGEGAVFSPVAVTPDELGSAWDGARLRGALSVAKGGASLGVFDVEGDFGELVDEAARGLALGAGAILGGRAVFRGEAAVGDALRVEMRDAQGRTVFGAIEPRLDAGA